MNNKIRQVLDSEPLIDKQKENKCINKVRAAYQELLDDRLMKIRDRSRCFDLFWLVKLGNCRMYKWGSIKKLVKFRVTKQTKFELLAKM